MADQYHKRLREFRAALDETHKIAHDGFKAPELTVEAAYDLMVPIWNLQVAYAAMMLKKD